MIIQGLMVVYLRYLSRLHIPLTLQQRTVYVYPQV
jgi:hypothetical protein